MAEIIKKKSLIFLVLILLFASFLRLWKLDKAPVSLFGDELDEGYQAYSVLKTGRDYQGNFMPINFHSFAEWRTSLSIYSAVPGVWLFGISPLGLRLTPALYGILGILVFYLLIKRLTKSEILALLCAFILAVSPWHIQYSRAGAFEATMLLFFLMLGLYFFLVGLKNGKQLWISMLFLGLSPLIYSTAKFFIPFFLLGILIIWKDELLKISRKYLVISTIVLILVSLPVVYATFFAGGTSRFNYISIFSDPTIEQEVGVARLRDSQIRGETGVGIKPRLLDRVIHNKYIFWGQRIVNNYFQSFSTEFLFIKGDINLRHSIGTGEFFKVEGIVLILGLIFFLKGGLDNKIKKLMIFWIILAPLPSALTRDGGNHATRLILMLPPLVFLIAYGIKEGLPKIFSKFPKIPVILFFCILAVEFLFYQHEYWNHYLWNSERWWHYGWIPAISEIKSIDSNYDRVIISMSGEPAWIFFAAGYPYPPDKWQKEFPIGRDEDVKGFGKISHTGKYFFGSPDPKVQIYGLGDYIDSKTLYLANASEVGANLILNPGSFPHGLKLIKAIPFPSGEPAFYLFSGTAE
jgi:4-amino-4-deoxy-L-arabinose transferase-like glycosyltransferase